jgi:ABC-type multidrug transport system fused ATPase/permease subunit
MIRQFFAYYLPYRGLFFLDFTSAVIVGLLELVFPLAINQFIDRLLPSQNWPMILLAAAGLLVIYAINTWLQYVVTYWGHMLGINIETDMRRKAFDHIQKLSFRFFDNNKTGHLLARVTTDLHTIGEVAHHGPEDVFIAVMTLVGAFGLMAWINFELTALTFIIVPLVAWVAVYFNQKMTHTYTHLFDNLGQVNARVEDTVGGIRVVQAFANEAHEAKLFAENNQNYRTTKLTAYNIMAKSISFSYMLMRFIAIFVMVCGTWFVIQGELTYGEFVAFLLLTDLFFRPIEKINAVIESYPSGIAGFKRYQELLATEPDIVDAPDAVADAYRRLLADDVQPDRRVDLVAGVGMVRSPTGLDVARTALAHDRSPEVRLQAVFALTANADPETAMAALLQAADDAELTAERARCDGLVFALGNLERQADAAAMDRATRRLDALSLSADGRAKLAALRARTVPGEQTAAGSGSR